jgi:hypothetical protein
MKSATSASSGHLCCGFAEIVRFTEGPSIEQYRQVDG